MLRSASYLVATRHPWSCVIFVGPLLLVYELGLYYLGADESASLRNGADTWLRWGLAHIGLEEAFWAPAILLGVLVLWSVFRRRDRPGDYMSVWVGMAVESGLFAIGLWALSRSVFPFLDSLGFGSNSQPTAVRVFAETMVRPTAEPAFEQVVSFIGAGIYEETLFRLLIFSCLTWILRLVDIPWTLAGLMAAVASALLFAAAHNLGPSGEPFDNYVFAFRAFAGVYFTALYRFRGFGVAVGSHAGYDVLVGVLA